ncbi:MAG: ATP-dependent acyl-CoA ligase [Betaproteobacteria bacterium]|nr:ATP-dependent acyl-CoA ligase [Betaproteobacteria bacterium]
MPKILDHEPHALTLRDLVLLRSASGKKPFLICRDEVLTYAEAHSRSNEVANRLLEFGVRKGDVVATFMYNSVAQALIWFGCAKIGAIYAPLNVSLVRDDLAYSLNDSGATMLILDEELATAYNACRNGLTRSLQLFVYGAVSAVQDGKALRFDRLLGASSQMPDADVRPTDPAAIIYTGGSTSMPKAVLASHLYFMAAAIRYGEIAQVTSEDVGFANSHFFHIGGQQFGVTGPLYHGMTGVMEKWFSVTRYLDTARRYGATVIDPIGTMIAALMNRPASPLDRDHRMRVGIGIASGQIRREVRDGFEQRFGVTLLEVYSMTEMGVLICSERMHDRRAGSCGRTHGWADVRIVDPDDNPVPPGTPGQILLRPNTFNTTMMRYVNKPEETIAAWKNFWYHTGDIGRVDEDGYVYFVGREAHWVRRRGENVSAFEVEKAITSHAAVLDCAIVGVPSELGEEDIKAYVHLKPGQAEVDPMALIDYWKERIAFFKVPRYVEFVDGFPRTMTKNEIARHELRARGIGNAWDSTTKNWIGGQ